MTLRRAIAGLSLMAILATAGLAGTEPSDYRTDNYRAPVPDTLEGATVIDDRTAHALWRAGVAFVDVVPRPEKPANLPEGTLWIDRKRQTIPGAVWAPNTGFGGLSPERDAYFRGVLKQVTGGDKAVPVVIFCEAGCWMSWNAARRAVLEYGYTAVHWYPDGTDGWHFEGYPLAPVAPAD